MNRFLTVDEAAELLRVRKQTIYKWICERRIPSLSLGGRTLFDQQELLEWLDKHHRKAI